MKYGEKHFPNGKMIFSFQENEAIRERIEKLLNGIKSFIHRKRLELNQSIDSAYASIDLSRRSVEIKVIRPQIK